MAQFYTTETLSLRKQKTPEGYLVCLGVPVTRTGDLQYLESEILQNGSSRLITARRRPQDLFTQETINSFIGKPVTIRHPDKFVDVDNHNELAVGHIQDCYIGMAEDADKLLCDIVITNPEAIKIIEESEMREVSVGYDTEYVAQPDGSYLQTQIRANHLAIVEQGRAGASCAIKDNQPKELNHMSDNPEKTILQKIRDALAGAEDKQDDPMTALKEQCDAMKSQLDGMGALKEQFDAIAQKCDALQAKIDDMCKSKDAAPSTEPDKDLIAAVEVIAPGTQDSATMADVALQSFKTKDAALVAKFEKLPARDAVIACAEIVISRTNASKSTTDSTPKPVYDFHKDWAEKVAQLRSNKK